MSLTKWERATEIPLLAGAAVFLLAYSWQVLATPSTEVYEAMEWVVIGVWVFFGVDYVARWFLAQKKLHWFFTNVLDFITLVLPPLRPLRLLHLVLLINVVERHAPRFVRNRILVFAIFSTILLVYIAALAVLEVERPHGAITTFGDSLWWALVTVTTVGYGDYTPITPIGRLIAVGLMLGGIVLVGIIVGTLGSWIIESVTEDTEESIDQTTRAVEELRDEVQQLRALVEKRTDSPDR